VKAQARDRFQRSFADLAGESSLVFRAIGPQRAGGRALTLTVSGKSVQQEVRQRERAITNIYDPRHHELAAELGRSSDAPVVRIEGIGLSGAEGVLGARRARR
jgi:hypothetical protein